MKNENDKVARCPLVAYWIVVLFMGIYFFFLSPIIYLGITKYGLQNIEVGSGIRLCDLVFVIVFCGLFFVSAVMAVLTHIKYGTIFYGWED